MIKILAVLALTIMCYLILKRVTYASVPEDEYFLWGWIGSIVTGFFINWFVKAIE